jgi:apolipoprotein N-acyltransferase
MANRNRSANLFTDLQTTNGERVTYQDHACRSLSTAWSRLRQYSPRSRKQSKMKLRRIDNYWSRCLLAAATGLLLAAAFPKPSWAVLAWIAPALMLLCAAGFRGRQAFGIGYAAGLGFWLATLYWILYIPFAGGPIVGWLALGAYLALFQATWVWLCVKWQPASWFSPPARASILPGLAASHNQSLCLTNSDTLDSAASSTPTRSASYGPVTLWPMLCAAAWVGLEMIRARLWTGFPWSLLGVSQYEKLPLIQIAAWTGVYGISFLLVWFSVAALLAVQCVLKHPVHPHAWLRPMALPLLALSGTLAYGMIVIAQNQPANRFLKVVLVQPSIPQTLIWDENESTNRFEKMLELSELAMAARPQLMIWPESSVPNGDPAFIGSAIKRLVAKHRVWLIFGADDAEPRQPPRRPNDYAYFNSSILASPDGRFPATYRKQQLVVFGEYVPLVRWLPFLKWFTPVGEGFTPGKGPIPFHLPDLGVTTSVLICFEDVFPHLARHYVDANTDFLINITNDGWFGESAAQWQQAANAVFRAVEHRLPLVRCANNGLTCWIDAQGRLHEVYFGQSTDIYAAGFKTVSIPLLEPGEPRHFTGYRRYGDWFGWGCVAATGLFGVWHRLHSQNPRGCGSKARGQEV